MVKLFPDANISLSCEFSGIPEPTLMWTQDGLILNEFDADVSIITTNETSELMVFDMMGESGGEYICAATNIVGVSSQNFTIECKLFYYNIAQSQFEASNLVYFFHKLKHKQLDAR